MDITMCVNKTCLKKDICFRQTAKWSERQSFAEFTPKNNTVNNFKCEHFWLRKT